MPWARTGSQEPGIAIDSGRAGIKSSEVSDGDFEASRDESEARVVRFCERIFKVGRSLSRSLFLRPFSRQLHAPLQWENWARVAPIGFRCTEPLRLTLYFCGAEVTHKIVSGWLRLQTSRDKKASGVVFLRKVFPGRRVSWLLAGPFFQFDFDCRRLDLF